MTRLTLIALLGATIERGDGHLEVFRILRPNYDLEGEGRRLVEAGEAHEASLVCESLGQLPAALERPPPGS